MRGLGSKKRRRRRTERGQGRRGTPGRPEGAPGRPQGGPADTPGRPQETPRGPRRSHEIPVSCRTWKTLKII